MYRKDYIQKQLEQLSLAIAKVIADLMGTKPNGNFTEAIGLSDETLQSEFDLSLRELIALHPEETPGYLTEHKLLIPGKLNLVADLLFATSALYEKSGDTATAKNILQKTLLLYEHVNAAEKTFSAQRQHTINTIKLKLYEPE